MKTVGIICEYNPFHYGHLYHLQKVKEQFKNHPIVLVLSSHFSQRGEVSVLTKWDKTKLALFFGVDLVLELPFAFATQSADIFAKGAIEILNHMNVDYLVFGSETNDISLLEKLADIQLNNKEYDTYVQKYLKNGDNYPTATSKAFLPFINYKIEKPNDLLALSYIKEIKKSNSHIKPISILRTNNYHELSSTFITSASSIRQLLKENKEISFYIPPEVSLSIHPVFIDQLFPFFKYKVLTSKNINIYKTVDEGLSQRIKKCAKTSSTFDEFMSKMKTKRYTYNRLTRMMIHILCDFTKEESLTMEHISYIRVLGFSKAGKSLLKNYKGTVPIITHLKDKDPFMNLEIRATTVYQMLFEKENLIQMEYQQPPIYLER